MEKKNQIPKYPLLRFPEFTDEWKEVKLGEVGEYVRGLTYNADDVQDTGTIVIRANNLNDGCPIDFKTELVHVSILPDPHQILRNADITICMANGSSHLVGKASYCCDTSLGTITVGAFCGIFRSTNDLARWIFQTPTYKRYIYKAIQGGNGAIANLKSDDILNQSYFLPSLPEQRKIAALLSLIDERIEVQNAIIKEQEALKASLLRRLFDRTLCFPEFTDEWKEVRLGEVTCERNETNAPTLPLLSITANKGVIPQTDSEKKDVSNADKSKYKRICSGDIGYNTMRMWQGRSALSFVEGIVSPAYTIVTPLEGVSPLFLSYLIKRPRLIYEFWTHSQGLVEDTLNCKYKDFAQITITIPSLPEQRKIAALLSAIDERITVEKEYATLLQKQKAYLLRQMFV